MANLTKSGGHWQVTQSGVLKWTTAWLVCATVPNLAFNTSGTPHTVTFGDINKDNAYWWSKIQGLPTGADEIAAAYITAKPQEYTFTDDTLSTTFPTTCDFLRVKARINRTTNPTTHSSDSNCMLDLTPIPPINEWFMAHGGFIPLEQHHPLSRAIYVYSDGAGNLKLKKIQSVGQDNLPDDSMYGWAIGNNSNAYNFTGSNGATITNGAYTYSSVKGQPVEFLGQVQSGNTGNNGFSYQRGGTNQLSLTDPTNFNSVYAVDLDVEPGYFNTDAVLKAPGQKSALRCGYFWKNTFIGGGTGSSSDTLSVAIGNTDSTRNVLVMIAGGESAVGATEPTSVTIGGVSATLLEGNDPGQFFATSIWIASVPTGTTANVVINWPTNSNWQYSVLVYSLYHMSSYTPVNASGFSSTTQTSNPSVNLTTTNGGFAFCIAVHMDAGDKNPSQPGDGSNLLGGFSVTPGFHAMTFVLNTSTFEICPCCYEAVVQPTTGATIAVTMAGQTNRRMSWSAVSFF